MEREQLADALEALHEAERGRGGRRAPRSTATADEDRPSPPSPPPWRHLTATLQQGVAAWSRRTRPLLSMPLTAPWVVGLGVMGGLLPLVLWWCLAPAARPAPPSTGVDVQQVLTALHTAVGRVAQEGPTTVALQEAEVTLHVMVQPGADAREARAVRLVTVDPAVAVRPEHVQTVTLRWHPAPALPTRREATGAPPPASRPPDETSLRPPPAPKPRAKP